MMITLLKEHISSNLSLLNESPKKLVDVGSGSGCLGITAKLEIPEFDVTLLDISSHSLKVAATNAEQLLATVAIIHSDLLAGYPFRADFILANLPYVDKSWERSPETNHEPELALFAKDHGLQYINKLIPQAATHIAPSGLLLIEADPRQHSAIIKTAKKSRICYT